MKRFAEHTTSALVGLGALLTVSPSGVFAAEPAPVRPPNVVFILADDLSAAELSCYGQRRYRTPNLDRMASQGIRFTDCYSGAPVCAPSRSVLLTGQHNGRTRVRANGGVSTAEVPAPGGRVPLYPADNTVAKVLKGDDILGDKLMKEYKALPDFKKYTIGPVNGYHISYRRNEQADCNLRKNTGKHLLSNSKVDQLIPANKTAHVVLTKQGGHITLTVDGATFMDFTDDGKLNNGIYGAGKFGFRQVYESEGQYDNFNVYDLGKGSQF